MDRDEFVKHAKEQLDTWNGELKKLQDKMDEAGAAGQAQMKEQMAAFADQREKAEKVLEDVGKANVEAWKDMQEGMKGAWDSLGKSFEAAKKRYEK